MIKTAEIFSTDFSKGLITVAPAHLLPDGASPATTNWDLSRSIGALVKRKGISVEFTEETVAANPSVCGFGQIVTSGGTTKYMAAANDDIYELSGSGTWTSRFSSGTMDGAETNMATFDDLLVIVNENITTQKWSGAGATGNLLGTPPSNAKYIDVHKGRLWIANSSAGSSRLHYSSVNDAEDWTATGDDGAGFIDININDGQEITGIASIGTSLIVFKKNTTYVVTGYKPSTFQYRKIADVGCVSNRSIAKCEGFCIFLGDRGIYSVNGDEGATLLSFNIKQDIENLSTTVKGGAAGGRYRSQYWLAYDSDADGKNDKAYILDYVSGIWFQYTNINAKVFLTNTDGVLLSGGSDKVIIREHNDTEDDEGGAITATWDSKAYDMGSFAHKKQIQDLFVCAEALSAKTITCTHLLDGVASATTFTFTLTGSGSVTSVMDSTNIPQASQGRFIQFRFSNAQTTAPIKFYGYSALVEVREREDY